MMKRGTYLTLGAAAIIEKKEAITPSQFKMLLAGLYLRDRYYETVADLRQTIRELEPEINAFMTAYNASRPHKEGYSWDDAVTAIYLFTLDERWGKRELNTAARLGHATRTVLEGAA